MKVSVIEGKRLTGTRASEFVIEGQSLKDFGKNEYARPFGHEEAPDQSHIEIDGFDYIGVSQDVKSHGDWDEDLHEYSHIWKRCADGKFFRVSRMWHNGIVHAVRMQQLKKAP